MTATLADYRRFFAEEIEACAGLRTPGLAEAFAIVERERFLGPGPWVTRSEADFGGPSRTTPDADPRRVYHNVVLAIDPARQLFNGQPGTLGVWIDALALRPGARVLHVGAGRGYYSAIMAHVVGAGGRVVAIEVDEALARDAKENLNALPWVEVQHGDGRRLNRDETFEAILVNAGVTHPEEIWLDALAPNGRLMVPLTVVMPPGSPIGKGIVVLMTNDRDGRELSARVASMVMIYSAVGIRDAALNDRIAQMLKRFGAFPPIARLRRDPHAESSGCCLHTERCCLSGDGPAAAPQVPS